MPVIQVNTRTGERQHSLEMYYHWQGPEGAPIIVWLAGIGQDHLAWGLQVSLFSKKFRCLMIDNRDVGRTGRAATPYTGADMAADLAGLLEVLDVPKVSVVGLSLGGVIAQEFAINYPQKLERLALISTFPGDDNWLASLAASWADMYRQMPIDEFMRAVNPAVFTWRTFQYRPIFLETLVKRRAANPNGPDAAAFGRQSSVTTQHNTVDRLPQITAPTLILVGEEDMVTPIRMSRKMADLIPNSRLEIIPDTGHGGVAETPEPFNRYLADFFSDLLQS